MSEHERLTPEEKAQTTANLKLAGQFIRELIDHPERHTALPDKATIVLLPGDDAPDPKLGQANLEMADHFRRQGQHVVTWPVGTPALSGPQILPQWPLVLGEELGFTYDRRRDLMTVVFSQTDRPTIPTRMNPYMTVLIDSETRTATSMTITSFLEVAVQKAPALVFYLLHPSTQLIGMTKDELGDFVVKFLHDFLEPRGVKITWSQIVEELSA